MKTKVFIDGQHGTVGLGINERLKNRTDIELLKIEEDLKKNIKFKKELLNEADLVILCLPDAAAVESVKLIENEKTIVLDGSTAHRTNENWIYGIPELISSQRENIKNSKRITVPGCYATGFNLSVRPLIELGVLPNTYPISSYAITGYSGGGKPMINSFNENKTNERFAARPKNMNLTHKHLPEMQMYSGLKYKPVFTPIVGNYYQDLLVFIPIYKKLLNKNMNHSDMINLYKDYFSDEEFLKIIDRDEILKIESGFISPTECNNTNNLNFYIFSNDDHFLIVTQFDNLGKGASGAAVQNMNIVLGIKENTGL